MDEAGVLDSGWAQKDIMSASQLIANRFTIRNLEHDLLGRGGMCAVYRATDTLTGELVAVKVLDQTSEVMK